MADPELNINISVNTGEANRKLVETSQSFQRFSRDIKAIGKDLQQVSRDLVQFSGAITTGFGVAFANARKDIPAVDSQLKGLSNSFQVMSNSLASAALPTLQEFGNFMNNTAIAIQNFTANNEALVNSVLKYSALTLAITTLAFGFARLLKFIGEVGVLLSKLGAIIFTTTGLVVGLTVAIVLLLDKFNLLRDRFAPLNAGFVGMGNAIAQAIAKTFGATPNQGGAGIIDTFTKALNDALKTLDEFAKNTQKQAERMVDSFGKFRVGFQSVFKDLSDLIQQFGQQVAQSLDKALGDTLFNTITGRIQGLKSVLISFGEDVLRFFTQLASNRILGLLFGTESGSRGLFSGFGRLGAGASRLFGGFGGGGRNQAVDKNSRQFEDLTDNMRKFARVKDELMENFRKLSRVVEDLIRNFRNVGQGQGGGNGNESVPEGLIGTEAQAGVEQLNQSLTSTSALVGNIWSGFKGISKEIIAVGKTYAIVNAFMIGITGAAAAITYAIIATLAAALAAAWMPAAILASIATLGGAAAIGTAAVFAALGGAQASLAASTAGSFSVGGAGNVESGQFGQLGVGAEGGIVSRPTLALIGEAGPEAVVPLNKTSGSRPLGGGETKVQIDINQAILNNPENMRQFVRLLSEQLGRQLA